MVASKITFIESECRDSSPKHLQMFQSLLCVAGEDTAENAVHSGSPSGGLGEIPLRPQGTSVALPPHAAALSSVCCEQASPQPSAGKRARAKFVSCLL